MPGEQQRTNDSSVAGDLVQRIGRLAPRQVEAWRARRITLDHRLRESLPRLHVSCGYGFPVLIRSLEHPSLFDGVCESLAGAIVCAHSRSKGAEEWVIESHFALRSSC